MNLGGLLAGVSQSVVRRIEEEEDRLERIADEERSFAMRTRAAKDAERRKKQAIVDEYTGLLKMYGMNEDTIGEIASYGSTAMQTAAEHAKTVFTAGGDINTVYKFSPSNDPTTKDTSKLVEQTSAALQSDLTADVPALTTGVEKETPTIKAAGLTIDSQALQNFFPMEAKYSSVGAMEAGLLNLRYQARKRGDADKEAEYDAQLADLYKHKKSLADAAREDGTEKPAFHTPSSATSLYQTMQRTAGDMIGVEQGERGNIVGEFLGDSMKTPLRDYIATSNMLTSSAEDDQAVKNLAVGINKAQTGLIKNAARQRVSEFMTTEQYKSGTLRKAKSGKTSTNGVSYFYDQGLTNADSLGLVPFKPAIEKNFSLGETIIMEGGDGKQKILVWTGVPNPLLNGAKYIQIN